MKQKNSAFQKKLKQYSLVVAPVVASAGMANAQIVYHDIDPDILYQDSIIGDNYANPIFLDLDGDGAYDAEFAVWSSVQSNNGPNKVNLAAARPWGANSNAFMGYTNLFSATFCSTVLPLYCPSALNPDKLIEPAANFWALPGTNSLGTLVRYFRNISPPDNFVGQWNNLTDRYIGLRFSGGDGNLHYGWIRMDVSKSPASITLKDCAYESQNSASIKAGDAGNIGVPSVIYSKSFAITGKEGVVNIFVSDGRFDQATATVSNMLGQTIVTQSLNSIITTIDLNQFGIGVYVVTIHRDDESFSKKIFSR